MDEPRRLIDDEDAAPALRAWLREAPRARRLDPAVRARGRARLAVGLAAPVGLFTWLTLKTAAAAFGTACAATVGAIAVVELVVRSAVDASQPAGRGGTAVTAPAPAVSPSITPGSADLPQVEPDEPEEPVEAVLGSGEDGGWKPLRRGSGARALGVGSLAEESVLLERARRELRDAPGRALRTAEEHRRRFAGGQLAMERSLIEIEALHRLGRSEEARSRARRLLEASADHPYRDRVRRLLERIDG